MSKSVSVSDEMYDFIVWLKKDAGYSTIKDTTEALIESSHLRKFNFETRDYETVPYKELWKRWTLTL